MIVAAKYSPLLTYVFDFAGKNKKLGKKGKGKKKQVDPFTKKDWYNIRAPSYFTKRTCGKTLITRTQGTKVASEEMNGRMFEVCLADLNNDEDQSFRKMMLVAEEVQVPCFSMSFLHVLLHGGHAFEPFR